MAQWTWSVAAATIPFSLKKTKTIRRSLGGDRGHFFWTANGSMRTDRPAKAVITQVAIGLASSLLFVSLGAPCAGAGAAGELSIFADRLAGNTLSAVIYVRRSAPASSRSILARFSLQAYLRQDGSASVRVWIAARDVYTATAERSWTLSGDTLCLEIPELGPGRICANVHIWGPRIAGIGTDPYVMLDGDLRPGNVILATR